MNPTTAREFLTAISGSTEMDMISGGFVKQHVPSALADLNAMHEAEMQCITIDSNRTFNFRCFLTKVLGSDTEFLVHATAAQRAEAFLRTLGKWVETK
jgi:hypothetical protein